MSIASRQVVGEVNRIIEERMKDGYVPSINYIASRLAMFYKNVTIGSPSFKMRQQLYRKIWDVNTYNDNLSELYNDLNILYEEMVSQFSIVLRNFDYFETERARMFHEIQELTGEVSNLLLLSNNTDGYLYSAYDDFNDNSKIDLEYSDCEINTSLGCCTIKESSQGVSKVNMSRYYETVNFPILAEEEYADSVISNTLSEGTKFGNAFSGVSGTWQQNIVSSIQGPIVVSFIIDITDDSGDAIPITRIEMKGESPNTMQVLPLWSVDNVNFTDLPMGYSINLKDVANGRYTVWNFTETNVKYIKFMITKEGYDNEIDNDGATAYQYLVGFKDIGLYKMGYSDSSTLFSECYSIEDIVGDSLTVDKAAIETEQDVPANTSIDYYLSLGVSGETNPENFTWTRVSPTNEVSPLYQQIVDFSQVATYSDIPDIQWNSSLYSTPLETYNGISFYKVYAFTSEPVKDSVSLYRGKNDWQVDQEYDVTRSYVYNEEHTFGSNTSILLTYPTGSAIKGKGLIKGSIVVKSEPGTSPGYTYVNESDYTVNYTTHVITKTSGSTISSEPGASTNTVYVDYQYDLETALPLRYTTSVYILNEAGVDINLVPWSASSIDSGQFTWIETGGTTEDVSALTSFHMKTGWHKITTTAKPYTAVDRFFSVNSGKYLYQLVDKQYAFADELQEVSWFQLKYNTLVSDHTKYAVYDRDGSGYKEIIVNYKPQVSPWSSVSQELLCYSYPETYVLSYKYLVSVTNNIYLKAVLSRAEGSDSTITPTLYSYTIKLGY
jgi:hypothetical protein